MQHLPLLILLVLPILAAPWPFRCQTCERDDDGRIKRSAAARKAFIKANPQPAGCKGCVVDHIVPVACRDVEPRPLDVPANMQWQSRLEARAKDRWEHELCAPTGRQERAKKRKQRLPEYLTDSLPP